MSESRQLILRALSRLVDLAEADSADANPQAGDTNGAAVEESTPVLELSEDALLRALEDAARQHTEQPAGATPAPEGPIIDLGIEDELTDSEETTVDAETVGPETVGPEVDVPVEDTAPAAPNAGNAGNGAAPVPHEKPPEGTDPETVLLHNTLEGLKNVTERDEIARVVLGYAESLFGRAALFVIKREMVAGWEGVGQGMTQKTIRAILIPLSTPSVFKTVYETKVLYYGGVPHTTVNDLFLNAIGSKEAPSRIIALPFVLKGKVVCALYADGGQAADLSPRMIGQLYQLGRAVSGAFEQLILRSKRR